MKRYRLFSYIFITFFALWGLSASAYWDAGCGIGPFSTLTGNRCDEGGQTAEAYYQNKFSFGDRGEEVRAFQILLRDAGFPPGKIDGIYGPKTDKAAKAYYKKYPPVGQAPSIISVGGPQQISVYEQGTWTVSAYDNQGGNLTYSAIWGDEELAVGNTIPLSDPAFKSGQTSTFTHSYRYAGVFTATFTVANQYGQSAKSSITVNVGGSNYQNLGILTIEPSSISIPVGQSTPIKAWYMPPCQTNFACTQVVQEVDAQWSVSNSMVAYVNKIYPQCFMYPCNVAPVVQVAVTGPGSTQLTATYTDPYGRTISQTITVSGLLYAY